MNFDHPPCCVLITGKKGSGKTTYWLQRIQAHRAKWKFIFDPSREVSRKLRLPICIDVPALNAAVARGGMICFDSSPLFPGDRRGGFAFFSRYVFNLSKILKGVKVFAADELQSIQRTGDSGLPQGLKEITDEGRREEIDCIFAAQRLNEINDDVRAQLTEIVTFKHDDPLALDWLAARGLDPAAIAALPAPGGFIRRTDDGKITTNRANGHATIDPARKANRASAATLRSPQSHRRPAPHRSSDGRFSSIEPSAQAPRALPG